MGLASNVVSELYARRYQFKKKVTSQPNIFFSYLDCFRFVEENGVSGKKNHQGSRFVIECANTFTQKVMKVPR